MRFMLFSSVLALLTACTSHGPKTFVVTDSGNALIANPNSFESGGVVPSIVTQNAPVHHPFENSLVSLLLPRPKPRVYLIEKSALQQTRSSSFATPFGTTEDVTDFSGDQDPRLRLAPAKP